MILTDGIRIDWDLAHKTGQARYPFGLVDLVDGERHLHVSRPIASFISIIQVG